MCWCFDVTHNNKNRIKSRIQQPLFQNFFQNFYSLESLDKDEHRKKIFLFIIYCTETTSFSVY